MPITPKVKKEPIWMINAKKELGTKEGPGSLNNPKVVSFWKEAGLSWIKDDATPWCAGFVNAMLERSGIKGTRAANARSFSKYGDNCDSHYYGSIIVFSRPPSLFNGHVGFLVAHSATHVLVIGGNQGDQVSYAKFPKSRIIAKRFPTGFLSADFLLEEQKELSGKDSTSEA